MYEIPEPEELHAFMIENKLTGADLEALTGVTLRTAQSWVTPKGHKMSRTIPWATWALINIMLGKTDRRILRKQIDEWKKEKTGRKVLEKGIGGRPRKAKGQQKQ